MHVRTVGFSLAYSLATALFGGFTPAVSTYLIKATGNNAAPAYWSMTAALLGLVGTLVLFRPKLLAAREAEAAKA